MGSNILIYFCIFLNLFFFFSLLLHKKYGILSLITAVYYNFKIFTGEKEMFYDNELKLFCDTFRRSRIPVSFVSPEKRCFLRGEEELLPSSRRIIRDSVLTKEILPKLQNNVVYRLKNSFSLCFLFFLLPGLGRQTLLVIGPFAHSELSEKAILEVCEKNDLTSRAVRLLKEYCMGIPVIPEGSALFVLLDLFCEKIWNGANFITTDINGDAHPPFAASERETEGLDEADINRRTLEQRYCYENELLSAVSKGQMQKIARLSSKFTWQDFEMRTTDPLRNGKNYCIIMNTLLRKAAEDGGVHPVHLDRTSSAFARTIETVASTDHFPDLMEKMFTSYCRLVRQHSTAGFSRPVQETVVLIDSDFSLDLSLGSLAEKIGVTKEYLSSLFKKEVGKTVTEYIREKRMSYAAFLLRTTDLQIQTVAQHCGIEDLQYFSKLFKKSFSRSPRDYRENVKIKISAMEYKNAGGISRNIEDNI